VVPINASNMPPDPAPHRLFLAVFPPPLIISAALQAQAHLRELNPNRHSTWVRAENIHLTLKFLGEVSQEQIEGLNQTLASALLLQPKFQLQLEQLGCFPAAVQARVAIWNISRDPNLMALHDLLERLLSEQGFSRSQYPYHPHLTLARIRKPGREPYCLPSTFALPAGKALYWKATEIGLFQSLMSPNGPEYMCLKSFKLKKGS
jgi:RNA 2',3'-cyclic 3'-phosphodiesterase